MCPSMCAGGRSSERAHKKNFLLVCSDPLPLSVDSSSRPRLMCYLNPNTQPSYFPHLRTPRRQASQSGTETAPSVHQDRFIITARAHCTASFCRIHAQSENHHHHHHRARSPHLHPGQAIRNTRRHPQLWIARGDQPQV